MSGRPKLYNTKEELEEAINEYFEKCKPELLKDEEDNMMTDKKGNPIWKVKPPTLTGLALALGFESRQSIYDYEKNGEYSYTIKKARLKCENWIEENALSGDAPPVFCIFALKNYGWTDKQEIEHSGGVNIVFDKEDKDLL